jgi:hypothetical protein
MNKPAVFLRIAAVLTLIHSASPALERYPPCRPERPVDPENADLFENSPADDRG